MRTRIATASEIKEIFDTVTTQIGIHDIRGRVRLGEKIARQRGLTLYLGTSMEVQSKKTGDEAPE